MITGTLKIKIHIPWVQSLKEKRMVAKSLVSKTRVKFNVSIAEVGEQDVHKTLILGISFVTSDNRQADRIADKLLNFIETNTEGEIVSIEREIG